MVFCFSFRNGDSGKRSSALTDRDSALAAFVALVHASRKAPPEERLSRLMKTLVHGGGGLTSPVAYVGIEDGDGKVSHVWVGLERLRKRLKGEKGKLKGSKREVFERLVSGKLKVKGGVDSYSVRLPRGEGRVKMGFFVPSDHKKKRGGYLGFVLLGGLVLLAGGLGGLLLGQRRGERGNGATVGEGGKDEGIRGKKGDILSALEDLGLREMEPGKDSKEMPLEEFLGGVKKGLSKLEKVRGDLQGFVPRRIFDLLVRGEPFPQSERMVTVMVARLSSVRSLVKQGKAEKALDTVNTYLDVVVETLRQGGAMVGEVSAEAVVAWWGNPEISNNTEQKAMEALKILDEKIKDMHHRQKTIGEASLALSVGVATDRGLLCRVGSINRLSGVILGSAWSRAASLSERGGDAAFLVDANTHKKVDQEVFTLETFEGPGLSKEIKAFRYTT